MKTLVWIGVLLLAFTHAVIAQYPHDDLEDVVYEDVVYLKNGSVIRGMIIEQIIDTSLKIQTKDGNIFVYEISEVEKLTKEPIHGQGHGGNTSFRIKDNSRNKLESWYTYWGGGYTNISYPPGADQFLDQLASYPGVDHFPLGLDMFGFYWPQPDQRTLIGGIVNAFGDRYALEGEWIQINSYTYSASVMTFLQHRIGEGLFVRADLGATRMVFDGSSIVSEESDWGIGGLIGGGIGIPVTNYPGTRVLLNINYAQRRVEDETTRNLSISIGGLF